MASYRQLYRSESNRVIAGVAGGLAEYFAVDPTLVRLLFVFMAIWGGGGLFIYLILWLVIPSRRIGEQNAVHHAGPADAAREAWQQGDRQQLGSWLVVIGTILLAASVLRFSAMVLFKLWPLVFIALGLGLLIRPKP